jgi:t-SNARE complex subunit (syntaxin)
MKYMINNRKEGLTKVSNLMSGIRELGFEFNEKVDAQGERLEDVGKQLDDANAFTNRGAQELNTYAATMKGRGVKMAICLVILLLILSFLIFLILK